MNKQNHSNNDNLLLLLTKIKVMDIGSKISNLIFISQYLYIEKLLIFISLAIRWTPAKMHIIRSCGVRKLNVFLYESIMIFILTFISQ